MIDNWSLAAIFCMIALLVALELVRSFRYYRQAQQRDMVMRRLQNDVHALCAGAINMGKHMDALEQKVRRLTERQDQFELRDPAEQAYAHAIRLAQRGADMNDLVEHCGLAQGEAELLLRVHHVQRRQTASA